MSARHVARSRAALATAMITLLSGLVLSGCSSSAVSWDSVNQKVQQGVDRARGSVDDIKAAAADAGLDSETLTQVQDATASASEAITEATSAIDTASAAGQTASTQVAEAKAAIEAARAKVEAIGAKVTGPLGTAVASLADQLDTLAAELAKVSS